jgi:hypothetical protein
MVSPAPSFAAFHSAGELLLGEPAGTKSPSQAWRYFGAAEVHH